MAGDRFPLQDGLTVGETTHREVELRSTTAADVLDAMDAAERPVATPDGWQLVLSPARLGIELMRRQVVRIGEHPGPLALGELRRLSGRDLELLQGRAAALDSAAAAAAEGAAKRGRTGGEP